MQRYCYADLRGVDLDHEPLFDGVDVTELTHLELCDHVAILDHGKLVVAVSVDVITQAGRQYELALSRPLTSGELRKLQTLDGVRDIQGTESANYLVTLDLTEGKLDLDQVLAALLRSLLDLDITPRRVSAGRSLESHFLEVTGGDGE